MSTIHGPRVSPTLDLNFARNKSLVDTMTGRNLIDFSRVQSGSSKSSYFGADGVLKYADSNEPRFDHDPVTGESLGLLVEEARTNLIIYSEYFDNAIWTKTNVIATPNANIALNGTQTATLITASSSSGFARVAQTLSLSGNNVTGSCYLKTDVPFTGSLRLRKDGAEVVVKNISIDTTWSKFEVTDSTAFTVDCEFHVFLNENGINANTVAGRKLYIWGAQLEAGSFPTSYIPVPATFVSRTDSTQGASYYDANGIIQYTALGAARDNAYFPDENGVMRPAGLLLEAAGTNIIKYSQKFDELTSLGWIRADNNTSTPVGGYSAPDGTSTAYLFTEETSGTVQHSIVGNASNRPSVNSGETVTASVFLKAGTARYLFFGCGFNANGIGIVFDTQTGSIASTSAVGTASLTQSNFIKLANGWYRISITGSFSDTSPRLLVLGINNSSTISGYFGNSYIGTGLTGYFWGAQLETSSYPTSYIPTTSSTATRAADVSTSPAGGVTRTADVAQITGTNFSSWYNQSEGSFFLHERNSYGAFLNHRFELNQNSSPNTNTITFAVNYGNGIRILSRDSNTTGTIDRTIFNVWTQGGSHKFACGLEENNFSVVSGINVATDTSGTFPANLDSLSFGANARATALSNGAGKVSISRLTYYPERLSNTTLQKLTR